MPEIHINEAPPTELQITAQADAKAALEKAREAIEHAAQVEFIAWRETQSPIIQALTDEWSEHAAKFGKDPRFKLDSRVSEKTGKTIYFVKNGNGFHESYTSPEHALFLLVDSHRVRVEDMESTHDRIRSIAKNKRSRAFKDEIENQKSIVRANARKQMIDSDVEVAAETRAARKVVTEIAQRIRAENPRMSGADRDALVIAEIEKLER